MKIEFNKKSNVFHLYNNKISYVIGILKNKHLGHFYFGHKLEGQLNQELFRVDQDKGLTSNVFDGNSSFSLNNERLEYPCYGSTDFREPALDVLRKNGSRIIDFKYDGHRIIDGKPKIHDLPSTWVKDPSEALTLEIDLVDDLAQLKLTLSYTIFKDLNVVTRNSTLENIGDSVNYINRLMSLSMDLPDSNWQWMQFSGDWARERHLHVNKLRPGIQSVYSRRGASSANHNPSIILKREHTTEDHGEAMGISFVYSGNFLIQAEVDSNHMTRIITGINPQNFSWKLNASEKFTAPEAILTYTRSGLGDLSRTFHDLFRSHLIQKKWQNSERPIVLNNWEATYFDFDEEKILHLAQAASKLGVELFVLDDGWFGNRNSDTTGLGDWFVNTKKLPHGIKGLSKNIHDLGMKFGLWIEPEMINKGTDLIQTHPDWLIGESKRKQSHGRNQYVLDFSRKEVVDGIYDQLIKVLDGASVDYIKWDMNKNITEAYSISLPADQQGEIFHRYILGVYDLYNRLLSRYPNILFESCASGGGRFDPGMLYYAPQTWTSDNTDAMDRLKIQYGTSMIYPLVSMGSHVSAIPNHQVLREESLKTRADVAYFGTFGYELDVTLLSDLEKSEVVAQIEFFKDMRKLIHYGDFYKMISPFEGNQNNTAWATVSKDKKSAFVAWYQLLALPNQSPSFLKLKGLSPDKVYSVTGLDRPVSGSLLMNHGLLIKASFNGVEKTADPVGDYQSRTWYIKEI